MEICGFDISSELYAGARTLVCRGRRRDDGVSVIIKTHAAPFIDGRASQLPQEFHSGRRIESALVLRYLELIETDHRVAVVMEDFSGVVLANAIPETGLELGLLLEAAAQLASGLNEIHKAGLIHRDVNPKRILFDPSSSRWKYFDLGSASPALHQLQNFATLEHGNASLAYIPPELTGRTYTRVDRRSDLYSLGVTLYELATGRLPFSATDPLELIHCHMARIPPSPDGDRPDLPRAVAEMILKLMAKSPDDRYQSCAGLIADIDRCRDGLSRNEPHTVFPLGMDDCPEDFRIPDKLFGRDEEVQLAVRAVERPGQVPAVVLVVAGPPGVGKSALIADVQKRVSARSGFFVTGKFEQLTGAPYSAVKQAFRELVQLLLAEPDSALAEWKRRLVEALGNQGRVVTDLVPELERIIGPQAPTDPLGAADAQARFNLVFKRFLNVFTSTRGMTLFLDDWQWADSASLNFIYAITTDPDLKSLLVIGAYRDNEVDSSHRALQTLGKIAEAGTPASTIQLNPLSVAHLQSMLLNTLRCSPTHAAAVARAVHSRTGGNPFFVRSFLLTLHETGGSRSNTAPDGSAGRRRWTKV